MKQFKEPIIYLKLKLTELKQCKKVYQDAIYKNDSSLGTDQLHAFYHNEIKKCNVDIESFKQAIAELKTR